MYLHMRRHDTKNVKYLTTRAMGFARFNTDDDDVTLVYLMIKFVLQFKTDE